MPQNGYWIECVPVSNNKNYSEGLYEAKICSIPEARITAESPDVAIQKLRDKLASLRHDYCTQGKPLPELDNPITPPRHSCTRQGWISVYVQMTECCQNK